MYRLKSLEEMIAAITPETTVIGVLEDKYMSQTRPEWIILETVEELQEVEDLLPLAKDRKDPDSYGAWIQLKSVIGDFLSDHLEWVYRRGQWIISPEELLDEEFAILEDEETHYFVQASAEHFAEQEETQGWGEMGENLSERMRADAESFDDYPSHKEES